MLPSPFTLLTAAGALAAVLALVLLAGRAARLTGFVRRVPGGRRLIVQETAMLDQRRRLHLIACDGRHLLLLTGGGSDVALGWLPDAPPGAPEPRP